MELLRFACLDDYEAINRIASQVCALHASWGNGMVVEHPYPMDYYTELIQEKKMLVAEVDCNVIGYLYFYFWIAGGPAAARRKMVSIDDIGVEESIRNRGIGQRMMAEFREYAFCEGCDAVNLYVDAPNQNAIAFYTKCGFSIRNHGMTLKL